ncbi:ABC transporter ATP-binding protein [Chitinimonas sp. BJYL2]|uniref:ABC transporter ATP-binding protein n=1 Tax=Chitinimonas sp. BJYL2 TaxID=2976696 RepID=UPI0022B5D00F|nr:sn-glycerol-3-phosphate ABC transporter ATP-binding protein UgpC [Chitinimonas sp. BJYL2]
MAQLTLRGMHKRYGDTHIIKGIDLDVRDGEFLVFVGPSGCGKTTTLRMIAGLEDISEGELQIDGQRANDLRPADRGAAMVFQSYALYPHMTVAENMGFALKMAGVPKAEREAQVRRTADTLRLTELLDRRPAQLSGGQRQRVAIGRAIVRKPKVFLFDEPLSNLDASLRVDMRIELARLHKQLGATMIYVTHDQTEAMTLGDRIAVFHQGRIEQIGSPLSLYERPATTFVASFIGSPRINLIPHPEADAPAAYRQLWDSLSATLPAQTHTIGIRPEHLQLADPHQAGIPAQVELAEHLGDITLIHARVEGLAGTVVLKLGEAGRHLSHGAALQLAVQTAHVHGFDAAGQRLAD